MKLLPKEHPARRDLSFVNAREGSSQPVLLTIRTAASNQCLEAVDVFDVYEGEGLPEGKRSIAVAMTFRAADRTLNDAEVKAAEATIIQALEGQLSAQVRSA